MSHGKASLDIFWVRDESSKNPTIFPILDVLRPRKRRRPRSRPQGIQEIANDLTAEVDQLEKDEVIRVYLD